MDRKSVKNEFKSQAEVIWDWYESKVLSREEMASKLVATKAGSERTAVFCTDMINGFCKEGDLASPRIDAISQNVANLFTRLHEVGVSDFFLVQESHRKNAKEFESFGPHGIGGTKEAETIPELLALSFADKFRFFYKNCLSPMWATMGRNSLGLVYSGVDFIQFLNKQNRPNPIRNAVVCGNCTDLCVRELAMALRLWANEFHHDLRIIIPENCVQTFDLPHKVAKEIGAKPHPGDMMHLLSLYEMSRNGIDIVREIV